MHGMFIFSIFLPSHLSTRQPVDAGARERRWGKNKAWLQVISSVGWNIYDQI